MDGVLDRHQQLLCADQHRQHCSGSNTDATRQLLAQKLSLLLPVDSITEVLSRFLKLHLDYHVSARRLFIDNTASLFTAQLRKSDEPALLLSFPARVEPRPTAAEVVSAVALRAVAAYALTSLACTTLESSLRT